MFNRFDLIVLNNFVANIKNKKERIEHKKTRKKRKKKNRIDKKQKRVRLIKKVVACKEQSSKLYKYCEKNHFSFKCLNKLANAKLEKELLNFTIFTITNLKATFSQFEIKFIKSSKRERLFITRVFLKQSILKKKKDKIKNLAKSLKNFSLFLKILS